MIRRAVTGIIAGWLLCTASGARAAENAAPIRTVIKDYSRDKVRVLLRLNASKVELTAKGVHRRDGDFAVAWARDYGKGRVLYNGLGHTPRVWEQPEYQKMWLEMVQWSLASSRGDATPRPAPTPPTRPTQQ